MLDKLNQILFYTFVFILPWQTILILKEIKVNDEKFQYGTIGIYLFEIILLAWILINLLTLKKCSNKKILFSVLIFIAFSSLSILWSPNKLLSLYYLFPLILGGFLFLILQNKFLNFKNFTFVFISSVFFQGLIASYQFLTQSSFSNKWLGVTAHPAWQGGTSVIESSAGRFLRAYGGMPHPNILGGFLAISLLLGIGAYLKATADEKRWKYFLLVVILINFFSLLTTFSRSSFLTFSFGLIVIFAYNIYIKKNHLIKYAILFISVFFIITTLLFGSYCELFNNRLQTNSRLEKISINERLIFIGQAKNLIATHPILGTGIGNYSFTLLKNNPKIKEAWRIQPVHNAYLLVFAELGAIGFSLFLFIVIFIIYDFIESFRKEDSNRVIFSTIIISLLLLSLFDHWLWTNHSGLIVFWLLLSFSREKDIGYA